MRRLGPTPAVILTDLLEVVELNTAAAALLDLPGGTALAGVSWPRGWFTRSDRVQERWHPTVRARHSADLVGDLHATVARRGHDHRAVQLVARLRSVSPEFEALWCAMEVAVYRGSQTRMQPPGRGAVDVEVHNVFNHDRTQRLWWFAVEPVQSTNPSSAATRLNTSRVSTRSSSGSSS
jgi:hypothetical protein